MHGCLPAALERREAWQESLSREKAAPARATSAGRRCWQVQLLWSDSARDTGTPLQKLACVLEAHHALHAKEQAGGRQQGSCIRPRGHPTDKQAVSCRPPRSFMRLLASRPASRSPGCQLQQGPERAEKAETGQQSVQVPTHRLAQYGAHMLVQHRSQCLLLILNQGAGKYRLGCWPAPHSSLQKRVQTHVVAIPLLSCLVLDFPPLPSPSRGSCCPQRSAAAGSCRGEARAGAFGGSLHVLPALSP